jgi:hypothetical protein
VERVLTRQFLANRREKAPVSAGKKCPSDFVRNCVKIEIAPMSGFAPSVRDSLEREPTAKFAD